MFVLIVAIIKRRHLYLFFVTCFYTTKDYFFRYTNAKCIGQKITFVAYIGVVFLPFFNQSLIAQKKEIEYDHQQWIQYHQDIQLTKKWLWSSDIGYRWRDGFGQPTKYVIRTGFGYYIYPKVRLSGGIAYLGKYTSGVVQETELRPHQQITYKHLIGNIKVNQRIRIEQRFFTSLIDDMMNENKVHFRFRYFVMLDVFSIQFSKSHFFEKLSFLVGDEVFVNIGKEDNYTMFDQNRFMISPTLYIDRNFSVSVTWNSQFAHVQLSKYNNRHTNVIWVQVKYKVNLIN
ncbi:DUF2490 domain-containing protein [Aquimarina algicola]|uniref:DUF2490 domain-containing protein n=1 Tax=Aquimarina algicola TaxID=2589995 RepID=A0A504J252_9FLAO|nr:DUF2490 domain-containing protein [Aquimarina algicola]TPN81683.1 DUF2490 domain-containing protein [Aquimarina algicola]